MKMTRRSFALGLALTLFALPSFADEVLIGSSATQIPRTQGWNSLELVNLGPNTIWCGLKTSANAVVNKSRPVLSNSSWSMNLQSGVAVWCISSVAQVTGAATIATEGTK